MTAPYIVTIVLVYSALFFWLYKVGKRRKAWRDENDHSKEDDSS